MLHLTDDVDEAVALMVAARERRRTSAPMMWFFAILIVLALGGVAVVAAGRGRADVAGVRRRARLAGARATGPVTADDLRRIRFPLAFRGYRMAEVDALLDRLAEEREQAERPETRRRSRRPKVTTDPSAWAH